MIFHLKHHAKWVRRLGHQQTSKKNLRFTDEKLLHFSIFHSLLKPGVSGLLFGLKILSRSPSSLVCPSIDSSFVGGERLAQAGLDESVRNESLPVPPPPPPELPLPADDELLPNSRPLNLENF